MQPPDSPTTSPSTPQAGAPAAEQAPPAAGSQVGPAAVPPAVALSRVLAVSSLAGLIILGLAWELWLAPLRPGGSWVALKVLPLCIPLAGLLRHRMYTYRWVSLMVWLYFIEGVVRAWSDPPPASWLAGIEIVLCLVLFAACALHVHTRLRRGPA